MQRCSPEKKTPTPQNDSLSIFFFPTAVGQLPPCVSAAPSPIPWRYRRPLRASGPRLCRPFFNECLLPDPPARCPNPGRRSAKPRSVLVPSSCVCVLACALLHWLRPATP